MSSKKKNKKKKKRKRNKGPHKNLKPKKNDKKSPKNDKQSKKGKHLKKSESRKNLLQLSRRDLIKLSKKRKLTMNGTKKEMVDRILTQIKHKKENNPTLIKLNGLSAFQATAFLIEGYIHIHANFYLYPMDAIGMIAQYIKLALVRFDLAPKKYKKAVIHKTGSVIKRKQIYVSRKSNMLNFDNSLFREPATFIIGCSIGFSFGVHEWKIKLIKPKGSDWIGIVGAKNVFKKRGFSIFTGNILAYVLLGGRYFRSVNDPDKDHRGYYRYGYYAYGYAAPPRNDRVYDHNSGLSGWKKGDVVAIHLNCDKSRLRIFINDQRINTITIQKDVTYYAAVGSVNNNAEYQVLSFD